MKLHRASSQHAHPLFYLFGAAAGAPAAGAPLAGALAGALAPEGVAPGAAVPPPAGALDGDTGAVAGAGAALLAGALLAAACAARSSTEVGSPGLRVPRYVSNRLVPKNSAANTAVSLENSVAVPRAPNTVPEAPAPNPAPASAPLPRCSSTRPMIISASNRCTIMRAKRIGKIFRQ